MANWLAAVGNATPTLTKTWQTIQEEKRLRQRATEESAIRAESLAKLKQEREWGAENVQVTPGQEGQPAIGTPAGSPANFAQSPYDVPGTTAPQQAISPEGVAKQQQQVEAQKKQDAFMKEPVPVAAHPGYMQFSTNPDAQKAIIDGLVAQEAIDPRTGTGPRWKIQKALETMAKNEDFVNKTLVNTGKMYITQANDISEKISKLEEDQEHLTANGSKIAELKQQRGALIAKATPLLGSATELFKVQKSIQTLGTRVQAMKDSGEWNKIPFPVQNEFATAALEGNDKMWESAGNKWIAMKTQKWEPTTKEEAMAFEQTKHAGQGWKPQTPEEALAFERAKADMRGEGKGWKPQTQAEALEFEKAKAALKGQQGEEKAKRVAGKDATMLRKEFEGLQTVKDYNLIKNQASLMNQAMAESKTTKNFVAVDQSLITILNKMLDARSVVRPSEYARTKEDLSIWNRLTGKINKLNEGGAGLTPDDRNALYRMGKRFEDAYTKTHNDMAKKYRKYATDMGLDPNMVIEETKKVLDAETAASILGEAGGNKEKARKIATDRGYSF